jgi:hypothetical protein
MFPASRGQLHMPCLFEAFGFQSANRLSPGRRIREEARRLVADPATSSSSVVSMAFAVEYLVTHSRPRRQGRA